MDFTIPQHIKDLLGKIDAFIEKEIVPLQKQDDNDRFFDHRREWARTDFEHGGTNADAVGTRLVHRPR